MILHAIEAGEGSPVVLLHGLFGSARNFGAVQRELARERRVLALDLRNHGESPHDPHMDYRVMAEDVIETLRAHDAVPCALIGHSMGGKAAMRVALDQPGAINRLVVSDIAPVAYRPAFRAYADAMLGIELRPGLTRGAADAMLAGAVPDPAIRGFLLQNLRTGPAPSWRCNLPAIAAALAAIEGWEAPPGRQYPGPALFVSGSRSDYIRLEHRPVIRALFPATRFVTVKDASHWVHADNPAGFTGVVTAFLS